jgi:hypothetical protein
LPSIQRNFDAVWRQAKIPVVVRAGPVRPLIVRLPYDPTNRAWLAELGRRRPEWLRAHTAWSLPKSWFEPLVQRLLVRFRRCYVIQPVNRAETCAPACWNAIGIKCECSCLGANHGSGEPQGRWHVVADAFAVRIDRREFSCRLLGGAQRVGA